MRVCAVSKRYIHVCNSDVFVTMYLDHLKFYVVCINGRRYVCCSECYVVPNECDERISCPVQPIGTHGGEVMYFGCFCLRVSLVSWIVMTSFCMCVVNKHFELLEFVFNSVYVDLKYNEIYLTFTARFVWCV